MSAIAHVNSLNLVPIILMILEILLPTNKNLDPDEPDCYYSDLQNQKEKQIQITIYTVADSSRAQVADFWWALKVKSDQHIFYLL